MTPLRVAVDASAAFNQGAGIGRYARNVVPQAMKRLGERRVTLWYAPSVPGEPPFGEATLAGFADQPNPAVKRGPLSRQRMDQLWFRANLPVPFRALAGRSDVVYSPDFTAPPDLGTPRLMTVHDLAFIISPEFAPTPLRDYLCDVVPRQVERAARVLTVSETTAQDLQDRLKVEASRITIVPNGVEQRFFDAAPPDDETKRRLKLPAEYLLVVGTIEPRKNHLTLFAAVEALPRQTQLPLVIAGRRGWAYEPIVSVMERLRSTGRAIVLDFVPDKMLPSLYAGAAVVIYPSWYEGFGLPVLEAMATGVPIVGSDIPAICEVAGDTIDYAPPTSSAALAAAIEDALSSDRRSNDASSRRRARANRYRWDTAGEALATVIADVTNRRDVLIENPTT